tara:strand:+ start:2108 stop:2563 length:456 start_codon:yes stop_codon:yes gene_type:complete
MAVNSIKRIFSNTNNTRTPVQSVKSHVYEPDVKSVTTVASLARELVLELRVGVRDGQRQSIELFCKYITDFMLLHCSSQIGIGGDVIAPDPLEDQWEQIQNDYKLLSNKTHNVTDIWKKLSTLMSKHFVTKKMINADQLVFNSQLHNKCGA